MDQHFETGWVKLWTASGALVTLPVAARQRPTRRIEMSKQITITLPYPPSANRLWSNGANGRKYKTTEYLSFESKAQLEIAGFIDKTLSGDLSVTLRIYRPRRTGDLDNRVKATLDVMQGMIYNDDSQIVELHLYRLDDKLNPRVEVNVCELPHAREIVSLSGVKGRR